MKQRILGVEENRELEAKLNQMLKHIHDKSQKAHATFAQIKRKCWRVKRCIAKTPNMMI
jgi:hypothetical protein